MKRKILRACAMVIDVGAPLAATVSQFPIWIERSAGATVSGIFILFAILSAVPLFKRFRALMKSPSAPLMWGMIFGFLMALHTIIEEMLIISFVGLISNAIGWGFFKLAGTEKNKEEQL